MTRDEAKAILSTAGKGNKSENWPFIPAYCSMVGSHNYYCENEIDRAKEHGMPCDTWATIRIDAKSSLPDFKRPYRLATTTNHDTIRTIISNADEMFPGNRIVQAAKVLYNVA